MPKNTIDQDPDAADDSADDQDPDAPPAGPPALPGPGDPGYDWTAHYDTDDLYTHTFPDGTVVALKSFGTIYSKTWLYKIRAMKTDVDVEFASIDRAACDTARAVLEALDDTVGDPLDDLFQAWVKAGTARGDGDEGLTPGK